MSAPNNIAYSTIQGQCMIMLVVALSEIRVTVTKQEAIAHIAANRWFDVRLPEDMLPYPTNLEPRWHTLIAWSRKHAVIRELMFDSQERNAWCITRDGIHIVSDWLIKFRDSTWNASRCYLWTDEFKKRMFPQWVPTHKEATRPRFIYRDLEKEYYASFD
jgi:hypothetical protein